MNAIQKRPIVERTELQEMLLNSGSEPDFSYADLAYANFSEEKVLCSNNFTRARLSHSNFCGIELYSVDFNHAKLNGAYFVKARIKTANFMKADLHDSNFKESFLREVKFVGADLRSADFSGVSPLDCDFSDANFTGACVEDFRPNDKTKLDNITCDFVFLKGDCGFYEKYPIEGKFNPGDFAKFIRHTPNTKIMATNKQAALIEAKQVILQKISQVGSIDDSQLSEELGIGLHIVRFCLDELDKSDLIKQIKAANFSTNGEVHQVLRLTSKGEMVARRELPINDNNSSNKEYNFYAPVGSVGNQGTQTNVAGIVEGKQVINDYSINIGQNIDDINRLISSLRETIQQFPEEQREDAEMEIDDLEAEIVNPEKQDPKRFGRRLKRLAAIGTTVATLAGGAVKLSENANTFTDNIIELGEKLEVPIEKIKDRL